MNHDPEPWVAFVRERMGAERVEVLDRIQTLWSGYGEILRVGLEGVTAGVPSTIVMKFVEPPTQARHPRGWNTDRSHERKLRSYAVEMHWYESWAQHCGAAARVPRCFGASGAEGRWLFLLEDLDGSGFAERLVDVSPDSMRACLRWLADFHATFLGREPEGLWEVGTYWHLATRPDELKAIADVRLRNAAPTLDARLNACANRTFVHGDAKVANFCFNTRGDEVAAVDFQYVGGGCGIKDVAYFLSSCMTEAECERHAPGFLDDYFGELHTALTRRGVDAAGVEAEWRELYAVAWADFYRFLAGWSPAHWKIHGYSDRLTREVLAGLGD